MQKSIKSSLNTKLTGMKMNIDLNKLEPKPMSYMQLNNHLKSTTNTKQKTGSPIHALDNIFNYPILKSPKGKQSPAILTEEYEPGETFDEHKIYPQTTKNSKSNKFIQFPDRFKATQQKNEKLSYYRNNEEGSPKESFLKLSQVTKPKAVDEKTKKIGNLPLAQQSIVLDHNPQKLTSPTRIESAKGKFNDPLIRKPSNTNNGYILDMKNSNIEKNGIISQNSNFEQKRSTPTPYSLNNFLVDLSGVPNDQMKISKININNINNINTVNNNNGSEKAQPPRETSNYASELVRVLQEKSNEINKLNDEKQKLKNAVENLTNEVKEIRKMKTMLKDKEKLADNLQVTINEAIMESHGLKKEIQRESNKEYSINQQGRSIDTPTDLEGIRNLMDHLKSIPIHEEDENTEKKNHIVKKNYSLGKPDSTYFLSNLEYRNERNSMPLNTISHSQLFQRNFSATIEDNVNRKLTESPYYEQIKNGLRKVNESITQKKSASKAKHSIAINNKKIKSAANGSINLKKGEFVNDTPRKLAGTFMNASTKISDKTSSTQLEFDPSKRKFSHDPKVPPDNYTATYFKKKNSLTPNSKQAYINSKEKSSIQQLQLEESIDIPKALSELKERIKKLLEKHKNNHFKLKKVNELFTQKLESLTQINNSQ